MDERTKRIPKSDVTSVRFDVETLRRLQAFRDKTGIKLGFFINMAVERELDRIEKEGVIDVKGLL